MMSNMFKFHLSERTTRLIFRDTIFTAVNDPSYADLRDAIIRLQKAEDAEQAERHNTKLAQPEGKQ